MPYPAPAWDWQCLQSYKWSTPQHINVLELIAYFNYIWLFANDPYHSSLRLFHVLDSRVSSCVIARGRSSSRILNRALRRSAAVLLGGDLYALPLWTISSRNYSDFGSRAVAGLPAG